MCSSTCATGVRKEKDIMAGELIPQVSTLPPQKVPRVNVGSVITFLVPVVVGVLISLATANPVGAIVGVILGLIAALSPRVAKQWEKAIVLRLGRYQGMRGPGLFWVIPM